MLVTVFPKPLESEVTAPLVVASNKSFVFATGEIGVLGVEKFAVYRAVPLTQ